MARWPGSSARERIEAVATSAVRDASNAAAVLDGARRDGAPRSVAGRRGRSPLTFAARSRISTSVSVDGRHGIAGGRSSSPQRRRPTRPTDLPATSGDPTQRARPGIRTRDRRSAAPPRDSPTPADVARDVRTHLPVRDWRGAQVIGSGGTFTNLAALLSRPPRRRERSDRPRRRGVPAGGIEHILDALQI